MTIETGSAQNTVRPTASAEASPPKGKSTATGNQGQASPGGFMAILASLDTPELVIPPVSVVADGSLQGYVASAKALAAAEGDAEGLKSARNLGAGGIRGLQEVTDATGALESSTALDGDIGKLLSDHSTDIAAAVLPAPTDMTVPLEAPLDPAALLAQSLQWSAVPAPNPEPGNQNMVVAGGAKLHSSFEKTERNQAPNSLDGESPLESVGKTAKSQKDAAAKLASVHAALAAPTESAGQPDPRTVLVTAKTAESPLTPMATAIAMINTVAPLRREDQPRERSIFRSTVTEPAPIAPTYQLPTSGVQEASALSPVTPVDMFVAEKVAYWISNDVQNAEMKLDGIGSKPVEVSIRMQGNEAHIAFRTDELHARLALENASIHLRDLLQKEGLVLSGVSVGTSGTGNSGDSDRRSRQGMRQSLATVVQPSRTDRMSGVTRATGGSLDLFV